MKGAVLAVFCALALAHASVVPDQANLSSAEDDVPTGNNHNDPSLAPTICQAEESDGVLIAHEICNQFYSCSGGSPVALPCPRGLMFDPSWDRCEWSTSVDCGDRIIPDPTDDSDEQGEWVGNVGDNNYDPSQALAICAAEDSNNLYIAHENCNRYYQCWAGVPVPLGCPEGFLWNPLKDYCDFEANVDCGNRTV